MTTRFLVALAALACPVAASSQTKAAEGFHLSGSIRLRYETIADTARIGVPRAEDLVNLRTIVSARYTHGPVSVVAELLDSRAYDDAAPSAVSSNEVDPLELSQAYLGVDFGAALGKGSDLRVQGGRLLLDIGSRRLIATPNYRNTTNGFTGIRADLSLPGKRSAILFYVLPQQRLPDDPVGITANRVVFDREGFDTRLWGGSLRQGGVLGGGEIELSGYRFEERDRPDRATRDRRLTTLGVRLFRAAAPGRFDYDGEVMRQTGATRSSLAPSAPLRAVEAWFAHAEVGFQWKRGWKPHVSAEFDYASGDSPGGSFGRFDTLFGARRADFSPSGLYNAINRANLITPGVRLEVTPSKRLDAFVSYRELWLASSFDAFATTGVIDPSGRAGRYAGRQVDARVRWWAVPKRLQLEADGVLLDKGSFYDRAPNSPGTRTTAHLSLNATAFF
ncbi:MAG: alginate export family protein [Sphingomonas sp.]|uniref:alginate export family protein n=1 Tax=Sphingomonas sp. TaxID=28214 RepID=UPI0025EEF083|nr:alginate export family protein [Sphingomonas sp.]MBY0284280.1 alginate export family protein [Sphingomonas sp.]